MYCYSYTHIRAPVSYRRRVRMSLLYRPSTDYQSRLLTGQPVVQSQTVPWPCLALLLSTGTLLTNSILIGPLSLGKMPTHAQPSHHLIS